MNIWVIGRDGKIRDATESYSYEIDMDVLTTNKSSFTLMDESIRYLKGDFIMGKEPGSRKLKYFGIIDSFEDKKMICNDIITLINFEFPATRMNGQSFESHMKNLITRYLINDFGKELSILEIEVVTNTPHTYQPVDPPTPTNMMKYLINAFKKYNITWTFDRFENGKIYTRIENVKSTIQMKDNVNSFNNWSVSTTEVGKGIENHLIIVNKTTTNSESPVVLSEYWLTTENEVTASINSKVFLPTRTRIWVYDTEATDKPTYLEVAESDLKGSYYAHEISVDAFKNNNIIDVFNLYHGMLATIIRENVTYQSVLTGYTFDSESELVELRFGHIRSRLSELLE